MEERQTLDTQVRQQHEDAIDAQLAPVALGTVVSDQTAHGLDKLTQGGGTGEFDSSYHRGGHPWY